MENERISKKRRRRRRIRKIKLKIKKNKARVLTAALAILFFITAFFSIKVPMQGNTYDSKAGFTAFADKQFEMETVRNTDSVRNQEYEYDSQASYAVDYDECDNQKVSDFRTQITESVKDSYMSEVTESENQEKGNPDKRALLITTSVYRTSGNVINLFIKSSYYRQEGDNMEVERCDIYTYQFNGKTGVRLVPEQIMSEDYRKTCCEYFTDYVERNYGKDQLNEKYEDYLTSERHNFNKFILTDNGVIFFFESGSIIKEPGVIISEIISAEDMGSALRKEILPRYIYPDKPMVALTYDDGPGFEAEERILNCLENNGAVATFFYMGSRVDAGKELVKRAYDIGCEMGNHTYSHAYLPSLDKKHVKREINRTNEAVKKACGQYPTVFRPSYGETDSSINKSAKMPVIMWSVDTMDWDSRNAQKVVKEVKNSGNLDGKIILMHSLYDSTAKATEILVPWLQQQGYQLVTVSELIRYRDGEIPENGKVYR